MNASPSAASRGTLNSVLRSLANIKITVFCLLWLTVLTFWGTMYQVDHGIYQAQARFFDSFVFWASLPVFTPFGIMWTPPFVPLPGGMLTMGILFVTLVASFFIHYSAGWKMPGLMLTHIGLLMLLLGGFFTKISGIEANMQLFEGQGRNTVSSRTDWEIFTTDELLNVREIQAVHLNDLGRRTRFHFEKDSPLRLRVLELYPNSEGVRDHVHREGEVHPVSPSGFFGLVSKEKEVDPSENVPGIRLEVEGAVNVEELILWGNDSRPAGLELEDGTVQFVALRRRQMELPMFIELKDFRRTYYPGSEIPKDYRSLITVHLGEDTERDVIIKMNEPFRLNGWTFYQQSFAVTDDSELSVFAVTRNFGRLIPYWATGVTSLGLALHFGQMQLMQLKRRRKSS